MKIKDIELKLQVRSYGKKLCLLILPGLLTVSAKSQNIRYDTIRYAKEYYQKRVAAFEKEPLIEHKTIFLGNSLTQFGDWKKLLADSTVINRGIAGDNTYGVLARLNDIIIRKPAKLFIEIGINDISQNIPGKIIINNILEMVKRLHTNLPATQIYLTSILPANDNVKIEYPAAYHKDAQINFINSELKRYAAESNYTYIDLNNKVKDKNEKLDSRYAMSDGLHLNAEGYKIWAKLIISL